MMTLEQETHLRKDNDGWHAWSNYQPDINKMKKSGWTLIKEDNGAAWFVASKEGVLIRNPDRPKRVMTDEQRLVAAERLRRAREARENGES